MIELAQPWGLLALASIPAILALYSLRPRRRTVHVATTELWREALGARRKGFGLQRLMRDLALLLLLLAALLASLALADPRWLGASRARGDTVVVIDVSASMQARDGTSTRLARAREGAARLLDTLPDGARALLVTSAREATPRTAFEADRDVLRRALAKIEPTDTAGRPRAALELALALLGDRERGEIHFFTDAAFDDDVDLGAPGIVFHRVGGGDVVNVAITRFDLRAEIGRDDRFEVLVTLRNYGDAAVDVPLAVTLERERLVARTVALGPGARRTLVMPVRNAAAGRAEARIDVDDDLAADDVAFAVMGVDEALRVLLVGPGNAYLESVFEAMANVLVERRASIDEPLARLARLHDVVVVDRAPVGALAPGSYLLIDAVPASLPLRDAGTVAGPVLGGTGDAALVDGVDLGAVRIDSARRIEIAAEAPGVQRLFWSDETTLALAFLDGERKVVLLGFDLLQSNLPLQAAFPLLVTRSVDWLRPRQTRLESTQLPAGAPFTIRVPRGRSEVIVRDPSGEGAIHRVDRSPLVYEATARAGLYRYTIAGVHRHFAVNLTDEGESNLAARARIPATPAPAPELEAARASRPLWPYLLALALTLLAGESCVRSAPRAQRSA